MATLTARAPARSFHIVSLGCAKNTVDSEAMEQLLLAAAGHPRAATRNSADLLIVNTCGFIESAKQESIDTLLELGADKRADQKLIATGCLVERYPSELPPSCRRSTPSSARATGRPCRGVLSQLEEARAPGSSLRLVELAPQGELDLEIAPRRASGPSAYVKISDGCDQRCAFCAIPFMKGNHRSKPAELIVREVAPAARAGRARGGAGRPGHDALRPRPGPARRPGDAARAADR